ncbi:hypothetical protein [Streptomyces erythrochromogenes]|uniref:hypothetical protein n=1 Tax=Streptomyces erythrochromogenes TaxID=285574 RepID=UPI003865234F|nr:hypothetical protein OG489_29525 [Streptomyces erythrochromogenes]
MGTLRLTRLTCAIICAVPAALMAGPGPAAAVPAKQASFSEVVKPSDSITIPALACPTGAYLESTHHAPGRLVPPGVQVSEAGGVGVTIGEAVWERLPTGTYATGTRPGTATNWDPTASHEVTVTLRCTTDLQQAARESGRLGPRG